jgi:hypothetical protein
VEADRLSTRARVARGLTLALALVLVATLAWVAGPPDREVAGPDPVPTVAGEAPGPPLLEQGETDPGNGGPVRQALTDPQPSGDLLAPLLSSPDLSVLQALLDQRAAAVLAGDRAAYARTALDFSDVRDRARAQARALGRLPVQDWSYSLGAVGYRSPVDEAGTVQARAIYGETAVAFYATLRYSMAGYDRSLVSSAHHVTAVLSEGQWYIADDRPLDGSREFWDFGPIRTVSGERSLVVGVGSSRPGRATLQRYAQLADLGVTESNRFWGRDWQRQVMVIAPGTASEFAGMLSRSVRDYRQIAGIATAQAGPTVQVSRGDRVFVNPPTFGGLSTLGQEIVMRHEILHVATAAPVSDAMPTWMEEGFADYLGYRGTGVPRSAILRELTDAVRTGLRPRELPADEAFDGRSDGFVAAYEQSWVAAAMVVDRYGEDTLVALYRAMKVATDDDPVGGVDTALRSVLGVSLAEFTRDWRSQVLALAG